jgi:galactarate dehydratase
MVDQPRIIQIHPQDNVAIIANDRGLSKGTIFPDGHTLQESIPQGHKVALTDIAEGESIVRYGETIGYAVRAIPRGSWVEESLVALPAPPDLHDLPMCTRVPPLQPPLTGYTFEGYRNEDGSAGIKNILGISTSVQCVSGVLEYAVQRIKVELLPRYPNVEDVIGLTHHYGCGVAINAPDAVIPIRTLQNLAVHPNLGGEVLIVGLGCEKLQPTRIVPDAGDDCIVRLQEQAGFAAMVAEIMRAAEERLATLNRRLRVECPVSDLVIGLQCGGSDAFSGVTANPALGIAADLLVRAGATVLFSEVTEVRDAIHLLTPRAANEEVARALIAEMQWYDDYLQRGEADRSANPTPGNKQGGLANVVEKALGSIVKSGSGRIDGVLTHGEKANRRGLLFAATPASDFVCGTLQLASGIHLQVFTTGRGTPYGLALAPVVKVSTRSALMEQWPDLIDIDAGRIASGDATIEEVGWDIFRFILDVASGRKRSWADRHGLRNDLVLFNPAPIT